MSSPDKHNDASNGWDAIAPAFMAAASPAIGLQVIDLWASVFSPGSNLLDVGCGFGGVYTACLLDRGLQLFGLDASPTLVAEYAKRFPGIPVHCESAEHSLFFERQFDGVIAIGLLFLLPRDSQLQVLEKCAAALNTNGRLLFSAPAQQCQWQDLLTGKPSRSLGRDAYIQALAKSDLVLVNEYTDEGDNHYFDFTKDAQGED